MISSHQHCRAFLADRTIQDVATAMLLYSNGKTGFYSEVLAPYSNVVSLNAATLARYLPIGSQPLSVVEVVV